MKKNVLISFVAIMLLFVVYCSLKPGIVAHGIKQDDVVIADIYQDRFIITEPVGSSYANRYIDEYTMLIFYNNEKYTLDINPDIYYKYKDCKGGTAKGNIEFSEYENGTRNFKVVSIE